jgi:hypothetical protein
MPNTSIRTAEDARQVIQRRIDEDVDGRSDAYILYDNYQVKPLARAASDCFGTDSNGRPNRTQMRKLERVALSASTYSEIVNYVKSQAGRDTRTGEEWRHRGFAYDLHNQLEDVRSEAEGRAEKILDGIERALLKAYQQEGESKSDAEKRLSNWVRHEMRLRCVQRYVGHLAAEYAFFVSEAYADTPGA